MQLFHIVYISQCNLMVAFFKFSKFLFRFRKLLQRKPRAGNFVGNLTTLKLPLFLFDCDWSKKHVTNSYVF